MGFLRISYTRLYNFYLFFSLQFLILCMPEMLKIMTSFVIIIIAKIPYWIHFVLFVYIHVPRANHLGLYNLWWSLILEETHSPPEQPLTVLALHLGLGPCEISPICVCFWTSVALCRFGLDKHIVEISWVHLPCHVEKVHLPCHI